MQLGIGIGCYVEVSGRGGEYGSVRIEVDGTATVVTGSVPNGQGHETAWAQITSSVLGIPFEDVRVVHSDTDRVPHGVGTFGSRSLQLAGSAVHDASAAVLETARRLVANLLEAAEADIVVFEDGRLGVAGTPASAVVVARDRPGRGRAHRYGGDRVGGGDRLRLRRDVPVRLSCRGRRSRHRDRRGASRAARRGRRLRARGEPGARRGAGARRHRPGRRAGVVRAGGLRRQRQPAHRELRRLRDSERGGVSVVRGVAHGHAHDAEPARCEGHRRVGHDGLDRGGVERGRGRAPALRGGAPRHAVHARARLARHPSRGNRRPSPSTASHSGVRRTSGL